MIPLRNANSEPDKALVSWKEIASFLERAERTVKRWERERGLPVRRVPGGERGSVFAYPSELQAWLRGEQGRAAHAGASDDEGAPNDARPSAPQPQVIDVQMIHAALSESGAERTKQHSRLAARWPAWTGPAILVLLPLLTLVIWTRLERGRIPPFPRSTSIVKVNPVPAPRPEAEQFYVQGRYQWSRRTAESLARSIDFYTQAIVADPSYAQAYAGLAESYDLLPEYGGSDRAEYYARAIDAANKAIEYNPNLPAGHRAKAFALFYGDWDVPASESEFQRALALAPNEVETHHWYATTLFSRNEGAQAIAQIDVALRLDPTNPSLVTDAAFIHAFFHDRREANLRTLRGMEQTQLSLITPSRYLAELDLDDQNYSDYLDDVKRIAAISRSPEDRSLSAAASHGWAGNGRDGLLEAIVKSEQSFFAQGKTSGYWLARAYLRLGNTKKSIPYFHEAMKRNDFTLMTLPSCACIAPAKDDPDMNALLAQIHGRMYNHPHSPSADGAAPVQEADASRYAISN